MNVKEILNPAMLDTLLEMAKKPENRQEIITLYNTAMRENLPLLQLVRDTIGVDMDKFVDLTIKYGAEKSFVAYNAYRSAGFCKAQAMQLTLRLREDVASATKNVKS